VIESVEANSGPRAEYAEDIERRIDALLDAFTSGALKGVNVQAKLDALEARQTQGAAELAQLNADPVRLHPNLSEVYRRKVASLHDLPRDEANRPEAVRSLIDRVICRPTPGGDPEIELVGDLATMVHLTQSANGNGPVAGAVHDELARSVKVVAGAHSALYRTRTVFTRPLPRRRPSLQSTSEGNETQGQHAGT
jgi:site-specific DNA recombinase